MPTWRKSPEALAAIFRAALPGGAGVERRQMFGYPTAFVNGNMATGLHQDQVIVRLPEAERRRLLAKPGARTFEPMPGRPMIEYVVLPPELVGRAAVLQRWIAKAVAYTRGLPPKVKKGGRTAKATAAEKPMSGAAVATPVGDEPTSAGPTPTRAGPAATPKPRHRAE
jgi:TfoX/Sxy family transcriptional regulator of competence genes